jgi:putative transposase
MRADHPILKLCEILQVSASGYYDWADRLSSPGSRAQEDQGLAGQIQTIHAQSRRTYGSPRIVAALRAQGHRHGRNRVARLMKGQGLCGRQNRRYRVQTTDSNHNHPIAPNRLAQAPKASAPNQLWVGDITYIHTQQGWLYLAGILDLFSRKIVGWAMADTIDSTLVLKALSMALLHRHPPADLLFHSDRGVQYAAESFRSALAESGLVPSMSRRANCYDNAAMESFWSTLKLELVYRRDFATHRQAKSEIFDYIESFYNRQRIHSALGFVSPAAFELTATDSGSRESSLPRAHQRVAQRDGSQSPLARRRSPMGVEPLRDGAQPTNGRVPQRATGAPLGGASGPTASAQQSFSTNPRNNKNSLTLNSPVLLSDFSKQAQPAIQSP